MRRTGPRPKYGPSKPADPTEAATRCRCGDPDGRTWIYLNARCANRANHLPWEDYGFTRNNLALITEEYHRAWLSGELNDTLAPEMRPGYRPVKP
jgi:hypothetical protein